MRILSYNCRGVNTTIRPCLASLLSDSETDILCLQETWLTKQDLNALNALHSDFLGTGTSTVDTRSGPIFGHPPGGVAILWRSSLTMNIEVLDLQVDWVCGIKISHDSKSMIILCVYLPCYHNSEDRQDLYLSRLGALLSIIEDLPTTSILVTGDFNADISKETHSFGGHLQNFVEESGLIFSDQALLPHDSFTFVSDTWNTTSWLDHCLGTQDVHNSISRMSVCYHLGTHDHIPLCIDLSWATIPASWGSHDATITKLDWSRLSTSDLQHYAELTDEFLAEIPMPSVNCVSCDPNCAVATHCQELSKFYNDIIAAINKASEVAFSTIKNCRYRCQPGWSEFVADYYDASREAFLLWSANGKPRQGELFESMKTTRARFKYAMRFIKRNENSLRSDAIAKKFASVNPLSFWKEIRKTTAYKVPLPNNIDGVTGSTAIVEMWKDHFGAIFNSVGTTMPGPDYVCDSSQCVPITPVEIQDAISSLVNNKAAGLDSITAEHLKFSSHRLSVLLSICFTGLLLHGYLPSEIISVVLIPLIKDKSARLNSKSNYRPIAIASVLSKVFERIILDRISFYISTSSNQFGFKSELGTDMPIYLLKEVIDRYKSLNGNVFMCFLDASKAFDRVNHNLLFVKLLKRGVPACIVRFIDFWYSNQTMYIKWAGVLSNPFHTSNGVRQGGILSPFLFNLYVDDLSIALNNCKTGCVIGHTLINNVMYADDLVIFSPCENGLAELLSICEGFGVTHDILYNPTKSAILIFKNYSLSRCKDKQFLFILGNNKIPIVQHFKYLGHFLSDDQMDDSDIFRQCRSLYAQCNLLKHRFYMCSTPVKVTLFRSFCCSMYTCFLWWKYTKSSYRKCKVAYNDAFRLLLGYPRFYSASQLFVTNNIYTFDALIRRLIYKFTLRISRSSNDLINCVNSSDVFWRSKIRNFWRNRLRVNNRT